MDKPLCSVEQPALGTKSIALRHHMPLGGFKESIMISIKRISPYQAQPAFPLTSYVGIYCKELKVEEHADVHGRQEQLR